MSESWRKLALLRRIEGTCPCGEPATVPLYLHFRRPREEYEADATDPWYIHSCYPIRTCGSPGCEADFYAELLATFPEADVAVHTKPGEGIFVVGDDE